MKYVATIREHGNYVTLILYALLIIFRILDYILSMFYVYLYVYTYIDIDISLYLFLALSLYRFL